MILTLTPNPVLDRILLIDKFVPKTVMRQPNFIDKVGGNGLDVSIALRTLNADTVALAFVAGQNGQRLATLLSGYGVRHNLTWVPGETRIAHVVVETQLRRHSHIIVGELTVNAKATEELLQHYKKYISQSKWVVAGGTLPQGVSKNFYQELIKLAKQAGTPILLDVKDVAATSILANPPSILKMSREEFFRVFNRQARTIDALIEQAHCVFKQKNLSALVLTCGKEGILLFTPQAAYYATTPAQQEVNAAGAGDNASAGLVWRLSMGDTWAKALRWAAAAGAASALTVGTADCDFKDIERILPQTNVRQLTI